MNADCRHEHLYQITEAMLRWSWELQEDGTYLPHQTHDKCLHEETVEFRCSECGTELWLDENLREETT
jgi:hypothetical protein